MKKWEHNPKDKKIKGDEIEKKINLINYLKNNIKYLRMQLVKDINFKNYKKKKPNKER